jgi:hypothetical protein
LKEDLMELGVGSQERRPRSPRPSPTFPQAWAGVAKLPAKLCEAIADAPSKSEDTAVATMASVLVKEVEVKLSVEEKEAPQKKTVLGTQRFCAY